MTTTTTTVSDDLRRLADWLDIHDDFILASGGHVKRYAGTVESFRAGIEALESLGDVSIHYPSGYDLIQARVGVGTFAEVVVYGSRSSLCVEAPTGETITVVGWRLRDEVTV